jgi:hypothetical protein
MTDSSATAGSACTVRLHSRVSSLVAKRLAMTAKARESSASQFLNDLLDRTLPTFAELAEETARMGESGSPIRNGETQ